ncbi:MAG: NADH-quinone oxidoreductase subunit G [Demequinaceae bacterium]|nr:NADH-quinone oxidoreductase subunit G [Demequinaceae bacterium]
MTPPTVTAIIDGIRVTVPPGTLIIRAAESIGIEIPRFCDHPLLEPAGACRQCLVEIAEPGPDGKLRPYLKPQTSCSMVLTEGMVVRTQVTSKVAERAQRGIMELLLINHPLDCPVCDKGGECPLQNQAMTTGQADSRFTEAKRTFEKPLTLSTEILLDRERCILCQRCTRFSDQISGDPFIELQERGARSQVGAFDPEVLDFDGYAPTGLAAEDESGRPFSSYFSGNTIQICPVGALTSAGYRFRARPFDLVASPSIAGHDSSGSAIAIEHRRGKVLRVLAGNDPEVNEEWITDKDRFAFPWSSLDDRITRPLVRGEDGELREATWPEALARAADGLREAVSGARSKGVGVLPGGRVTLEDAYAYQKFARVVLGTNDVDARSRIAGDEEEAFLGSRVAGSGLGVTFADLEAAPVVALIGFEPEDEGGVVFLRLRKARGRQKVFTFAPFVSRGNAKLDATLVPTVPGLEGAALDSIRRGSGTVGDVFDGLSQEGAVLVVGERLAGVPGGFTAAVALADRTGARLAWIPRRAGERGAVEAGALPGLLPGGSSAQSAEAREGVARVWGVSGLPLAPGRAAYDILGLASSGGLSGLVVGGLTLSDLPKTLANGIAKAPFLVSLEVRLSDVTAHADVVFPVAPSSEKAGTFVNWEGRLRPFTAALQTSALSDHRVLDMLAREMGVTLGTPTVEAVTAELARIPIDDSLRPPPPSASGPSAAEAARRAKATTLATWHALIDQGSLQDGEPFLAGTARVPVARMSPATVAALGIEGRVLKVSGPGRGTISLPLAVTPGMVDGVVWLPMNSPGSTVARTLGVAHGDTVSVKGSES